MAVLITQITGGFGGGGSTLVDEVLIPRFHAYYPHAKPEVMACACGLSAGELQRKVPGLASQPV